MLVLTGKVGDTIKIGDDVEIVFMGTQYYRGQYKIGFRAPDSVNILRDKAKVKHRKQEPV